MSSLALSLNNTPNEYALLLRASMNFNAGQTEKAQEDFIAVSPQLPVELVQNIYFKVWVLSNRPEGDSDFGEKAMHNRLVNLTPPDNIVKARAIIEALIEHCPGAIPTFMDELNHAERCPISRDRMGKPTIIFSGYTFELSQIQEWQRQQMRQGLFSQITCPSTKLKGSSQLTPNRALEEVVQTTERFERRLQATPLLIQHLFQENVRHTQEIEALREVKAQNERIIEQLFILNQNLNLQNQELRQQYQETHQQNQSLTQTVNDLLQRHQTLSSAHETLVQEGELKDHQIQNLTHDFQQACQNIEQLTLLNQNHESLRLDSAEQIHVLTEQNQEAQQQNLELRQQNQTHVRDVERKEHQIQELTHDLQQARQDLAAVSQIQNMTIRSLQGRVNELEHRRTSNPSATATSLPTTGIILNETESGLCPVNSVLEMLNSTFRSAVVKV